MWLIIKSDESPEAKLFSSIFRQEVNNLTAFAIVELILGDEDSVSVTGTHSRISIDLRNDFIQEKDEKAVRFFVAQKIFLANIKRLEIGEPFIEEILANKAVAKAGYEDALVYYYYTLISKMRKNPDFEEFMLLNVPWLSLHGIDDYDSKVFLKALSRFDYSKKYEPAVAELFGLLKGDIKGQDIMKAVKLYRNLYARNQV